MKTLSVVLALIFTGLGWLPELQAQVTGTDPQTRYRDTSYGADFTQGLWRIRFNGDTFTVEKNSASAGDFSGLVVPMAVSASGVVTFLTPPSIPGLANYGVAYANATGFLTSTAAPTNGQLLIGSTGGAPVLGSVAGTSNQLTMTPGAGSITLSLAGPHNFATQTLNGVLYGNGTSAVAATAQGASGTVLHGNGGVPGFSSVVSADINITGTTCANQAVTAISSAAAGTCSSISDSFLTGQVGLAHGGTNASLAASNGGIIYSGASAFAVLAGVPTSGQILESGSNAAPSWSTATYPATTTINQLLYSSAANTLTGLATANNAVLVTSAVGVPSLATTGSSLSISSSVLNTIQGIRTADSPTFAGLRVNGNVGINGAAGATLDVFSPNNQSAQFRSTGVDGGYIVMYDSTNGTNRFYMAYGDAVFPGAVISDAGIMSAGALKLGSNGASVAVTIDTSQNSTFVGTVSVKGLSTSTNCSTASCGAAVSGAAVIAAGSTSVTITTTAVTANSEIHITEDASLGTRLGVTCNIQADSALGTPHPGNRSNGTSFRVDIDVAPTTNPRCFGWSFLN